MLYIKNITTIIALALCLVSLAGAEEGKAREVKLELIWEKKFNFLPSFEERKSLPITIRGDEVIFDEAEVTAKEAKELGFKGYEDFGEDEKVKIPYPKVMIGRSDIMFLGFKGNIVKKYPLGEWAEVGFSKNKQFIGILGLGKSQKDRIFSMLDSEGNILWKTEITRVGYTLPHISPNGEYVIAEGDPSYDLCDYYPSIWDKNGLVKGLFEEGTRAELKGVDFTTDGEYFVIAYESAVVETTSQKIKTRTGEELPHYKIHKITNLSLYTMLGKELWNKQLIGVRPISIAITPKGDHTVIVGAFADTFLLYTYDTKGILINEEKLVEEQLHTLFPHYKNEWHIVDFSPQLTKIHFYNQIIKNKEISKEHEKVMRPYIVKKMSWNNKRTYFVVLALKRKELHQRTTDVIYLFNHTGELLTEKQYPAFSLCGEYLSEGSPTFTVLNDKIILLNHTEKKIECYKISSIQ